MPRKHPKIASLSHRVLNQPPATRHCFRAYLPPVPSRIRTHLQPGHPHKIRKRVSLKTHRSWLQAIPRSQPIATSKDSSNTRSRRPSRWLHPITSLPSRNTSLPPCGVIPRHVSLVAANRNPPHPEPQSPRGSRTASGARHAKRSPLNWERGSCVCSRPGQPWRENKSGYFKLLHTLSWPVPSSSHRR